VYGDGATQVLWLSGWAVAIGNRSKLGYPQHGMVEMAKICWSPDSSSSVSGHLVFCQKHFPSANENLLGYLEPLDSKSQNARLSNEAPSENSTKSELPPCGS
jgi:hypothetical protein